MRFNNGALYQRRNAAIVRGNIQHGQQIPNRLTLNKVINLNFNLLRPLVKHRRKLDPKNKRLLFKTMTVSTTLYGVAAWNLEAKTNRKKIQVVQNKPPKTIAKAPWYVTNTTIRRDVEIPTLRKCFGNEPPRFIP